MKRFSNYMVSRVYALFALVVFASTIAIGTYVIELDRENYQSVNRQNVERALHRAADQIRIRFFEAVLVASKIENLVANPDGLPENQISRVVGNLIDHNPSVSAVAIAPDLVVTHSFPDDGSKNAVGLRYWEVPEQFPSIAQAYRSRSPVISGPVSLVQGGEGYILRYPVYVPKPGLSYEQFWGVISVVLKAENSLLVPGVASGAALPFEFDLRKVSAPEPVIAPTPNEDAAAEAYATEAAAPIVKTFSMMDGIWEAEAFPLEGWPANSPQYPVLLALTLVSAFLLCGGVLILRSYTLRKDSAHAFLSETIACIDEGVVVYDERDRLVMANQKCLEYHPLIEDLMVPGAKLEDLLRAGVARNQFPDAIGREDAWLADRLKLHQEAGAAFLQRNDNGRWLKVTEARTPHGYTVGIRTDVTAEMHALDAAEAADREKTEFLNNVSHELRTPLTVISGRAAFLANEERLPQSRRVQLALNTQPYRAEDAQAAFSTYREHVAAQGSGIADSAKHMLRLVEDLLDWTKLSRDQVELDREEVDLGEIAGVVTTDLRPAAEAKGLNLTIWDEGVGIAEVDRVRIRQIFYNLVSNAIKFTEEGGIHLSLARRSDQIIVTVEDTGCGIPEEDLQRVFGRFQQVDGSMSRKNGGLGLGLAISEQLARLHGGELSLESGLGEGSKFRLTLPALPDVPLRRTA